MSNEKDLLAALGLTGSAQPARRAVCDFCEQAPGCWYYPMTGPITLELFPGAPVELEGTQLNDAWLTCDKCHDFVEAGGFGALAAYIGYPTTGELPFPIASFRDRRCGPAQRMAPPTNTDPGETR